MLSLYDQIVVNLFLMNSKLSNIYVEGNFHYSSEVQSRNSGFTVGSEFYNEKFQKTNSDFNLPYKKAYLSRVKFGFNYTYLEHNELLDESEMLSLKYYGCEISMMYKELFELSK